MYNSADDFVFTNAFVIKGKDGKMYKTGKLKITISGNSTSVSGFSISSGFILILVSVLIGGVLISVLVAYFAIRYLRRKVNNVIDERVNDRMSERANERV